MALEILEKIPASLKRVFDYFGYYFYNEEVGSLGPYLGGKKPIKCDILYCLESFNKSYKNGLSKHKVHCVYRGSKKDAGPHSIVYSFKKGNTILYIEFYGHASAWDDTYYGYSITIPKRKITYERLTD